MNTKNVKLIAEHFKQANEQSIDCFLNVHHRAGYRMGLRETAENLATILKLDNPKFDRDKFIKECGL